MPVSVSVFAAWVDRLAGIPRVAVMAAVVLVLTTVFVIVAPTLNLVRSLSSLGSAVCRDYHGHS